MSGGGAVFQINLKHIHLEAKQRIGDMEVQNMFSFLAVNISAVVLRNAVDE